MAAESLEELFDDLASGASTQWKGRKTFGGQLPPQASQVALVSYDSEVVLLGTSPDDIRFVSRRCLHLNIDWTPPGLAVAAEHGGGKP